MQNIEAKKIYRVIDANFNRAKEGLRVCEDICRFFLNTRKLTSEYKTVRHQLSGLVEPLKISEAIDARNIKRDVGKASVKTELKRSGFKDIFYANSQRAKESIRVLEEFMKLSSPREAQGMKRLRYKIYDLERETVKKL